MTLQQIIAWTVVYAVALAVIVYFTRPTWRRFAGAFAGGAAAAGLGLWVIIPVGEAQRLCHVPLDPSPVLMALLFFGTSVSTAPILLVTWRIARRFGWRGLAVTFAGLAVIGPHREFAVEGQVPGMDRLHARHRHHPGHQCGLRRRAWRGTWRHAVGRRPRQGRPVGTLAVGGRRTRRRTGPHRQVAFPGFNTPLTRSWELPARTSGASER